MLKGTHCSEETRRKISETEKGKRCGEENTFFGQHHTEETKNKIRAAKLGRKLPPFTDEHRQKISKARIGMVKSEETRRKLSEAAKLNTGPLSSNWRGGVTFAPYCQKFNKEFKERVRAFFGHQCIECGTPQGSIPLAIHHVNFNKQTCCDGSIPLFVPLCFSCHGKTHYNREYWEQHFTSIIQQYYGGKCYFTKEEFLCVS
jgi:hypothetical protein